MHVYYTAVGIVRAIRCSCGIRQLLHDYAHPPLHLSLLHQARQLDRCQGKSNQGEKGQSSRQN